MGDAVKVVEPAYQQIKARMRARIGRQWPAGSRLPPVPELARLLRSGQRNTHRAVRELAEEGWLISRQGSGTFVAPPAVAREGLGAADLVAALSGRVIRVVVMAHEPAEFVTDMADAFAGSVAAAKCRLVRESYDHHLLDLRHLSDADALLLINPNPTGAIRFGADQVLTVINTAVETPVAMAGRYDVVTVDQEQGGFLAGEALREAGCRLACFVGCLNHETKKYDQTCQARLRGFERGWGEAVRPEHGLTGLFYGEDIGAKAVRQYVKLRPLPDAVFAATDELAVGFIYGAKAHGLEVGRDFQVVGFDGQRRGRQMRGGALTTVDVPAVEMGRRAARLLAERLADPDQAVRRLSLGCSLYRGVTVGKKR